MSTLYQIAQDAQALDTLLDEHLTATEGEITPQVESIIDAWLEDHEAELANKLEGYACLIKEHEAQGKIITSRAQAFRQMYDDEKKLADARTNRVKALKARLKWFYELRGIDAMQAGPYKIVLQGNGGVRPLIIDDEVDPEDVHEDFVKKQFDNERIREYLEAGGTLQWARLGERSSSIRIK